MGSIETEITGSGNFDAFEEDGVRRMTERVSGKGVLQTEGGDDAAGIRKIYFLAAVGMHEQQAADPFSLLLVELKTWAPASIVPE